MPSSRPTPLGPLTSLPPVGDPAVQAPATQELLGVPLALTDYERTMDWMDAAIAEGLRRGAIDRGLPLAEAVANLRRRDELYLLLLPFGFAAAFLAAPCGSPHPSEAE